MLRMKGSRSCGLHLQLCLLGGLLLFAAHGNGPADAPACPDDAADEAQIFWKAYFDKECSVEEEDLPKDIRDDLARSTVSLLLPGDKGFTSKHTTCRVSTILEDSVLIFDVKPKPFSPTDEDWVPIEKTVRAVKMVKEHEVLFKPCGVFGPGVATYELASEKLDEVMLQIEEDAAAACPSMGKYGVSLHMDQDTTLKVKRTMIEGSGRPGFMFDLKLSVNRAPDPVDIQVFVSDNYDEDDTPDSEAIDDLLERERDEDRILRDHNNSTDPKPPKAVQAPGLLQSKAAQQRRIGYDVGGHDDAGLLEDDDVEVQRLQRQAAGVAASSAAGGAAEAGEQRSSKKVQVYGNWTVLDDLITPPLCCLCDIKCSPGCAGKEDPIKPRAKAKLVQDEGEQPYQKTTMDPFKIETPSWDHPASMKPPPRGGRAGASNRDGERHRTRNIKGKGEKATGDLFHVLEMPRRTAEDHAEVWARSRALIQQAKEEGLATPDAWHFYDNPTNGRCWLPAYQQGECGSCWAFAALGALQKQICMRAHGVFSPDLSREQLTRCSEQNRGCAGGLAHTAYEDLMEIGGVVKSDCIPYQGQGRKNCPTFDYSWHDTRNHAQGFSRIDQELAKSCGDLTRYSNRPPIGPEWDMPFKMMYEKRWGTMPNVTEAMVLRYKKNFARARARDRMSSFYVYGEKAMKVALMKYGALFGSFVVRGDFKKRACTDGCWPPGTVYGEENDFYESQCGCNPTGHAIQIIAWGTDIEETGTRIPYWLIENSWGGAEHGDVMGEDTERRGPNGWPGGDPFTKDHPMNAEDQCVLAGWVASDLPTKGCKKKLNVREDVNITDGPPDGFYFSVYVDDVMRVNVSVQAKEIRRFMSHFKVAPGPHRVTFLVYARNHPKQQAFPLEKYSMKSVSLRCRGTGYLYSFSKNDTKATLSWGRMTRKELEAAADKILSDSGISPKAKLDDCPEVCRTGRYSLQVPCVGLLMKWGSCYTSVWVYGSSFYQNNKIADCQRCTASLIHQKHLALATKALPNATFLKWHQLVTQAFTAPDEAGWMRIGKGACQVRMAGFASNTQLNATYTINMPYGADGNGACDERHSAPFATGHFVNAPGFMPDGGTASTRCPMPLAGNVSLRCEKGVLYATSSTCREQVSISELTNPLARFARVVVCAGRNEMQCAPPCAWAKTHCIRGLLGYYKMLRSYNYHGIEEGASFAIAEMDRFVGHCPTLGWSRWSTCSATKVCESGKQNRTRSLAPGYARSHPMCKDLLLYEERSCVKPGFCPQVLMRFMDNALPDPNDYMFLYKQKSIEAPNSKAGAAMMHTAYPNETEAKYWCTMVAGRGNCHIYIEGHFQVKKDGEYMLRYETRDGHDANSLLSGGEAHFNALGPGKEMLPQYKVTAEGGMFAWEDFGFHHRRRRTDVKPWVRTSSMSLKRGTYFARVTRLSWLDPWYQLRLERMSAVFSPPMLHGGASAGRDALGRTKQQAVTWSNAWGAIQPYYLKYRERGYYGYPKRTEQGVANEILLRTESGNKVIKRLPVTKLNFTADELYAMFGVDKANPSLDKYKTHEMVIRSTVVLPDAGTFRFKYQQDTTADDSNQAWRMSGSRRRQSKIMIRVDQGIQYASIDRRSGSAELEVSFTANKSGTTTFEVSSVLQYDGVDYRTALPNFFAVEMKHEDVLHGTTLDFGTKIKYVSDVEMLQGEGKVRVDWPDRADPLSGALRLSAFQHVEPSSVLVGTKKLTGFAAIVEGKIDAGACLALNARVQGQEHLVFRGFALELCDVDGSNQHLGLKSYFRPAGSNATQEKLIGWVHTEYTHPTHLQVIRSPTDLTKFELSYRPDNRDLFATPFPSDVLTKELAGFTGQMEVGVSMNTPEAYRNAEFYNISIEPCPDSCTDASGKQLFCGEVRTPCGTTLNCSSTCGNSGTCQDNKCFDCPAIDASAVAGWECGTTVQVCKGREKDRDMQVDRVVGGPAPNAAYYCDEDTHKWKCLGTTAWGYLAQGLKCGSVIDECGSTVTLFDCPYANDVCTGHKCICQPATFPDDWNCGWKPDGCGGNYSFGPLGGHCGAGAVCDQNKCCAPKTTADFNSTWQCGSAPDGCGGLVSFKKVAGSPFVVQPAPARYYSYTQGWIGTMIEATQNMQIDRLAAGLIKDRYSNNDEKLTRDVTVVLWNDRGTQRLGEVTINGNSEHTGGYAWEPLPAPVTVRKGTRVMILMEVARGDKYCNAYTSSYWVSRKVDVTLARYVGSVKSEQQTPSRKWIRSTGCIGTVNFDVLINEGCGAGNKLCKSHTCVEGPVQRFSVSSGPCTTTDNGQCVQSPNYPQSYGYNEFCEIMPPSEKFSADYFVTEGFSDWLKVGHQKYSGRRRRWGVAGPNQAFTTAPIVWSSDGSGIRKGFRICVDSMAALVGTGAQKEAVAEAEPTQAEADREEAEEEERTRAELDEAEQLLKEEAQREPEVAEAYKVPAPESED